MSVPLYPPRTDCTRGTPILRKISALSSLSYTAWKRYVPVCPCSDTASRPPPESRVRSGLTPRLGAASACADPCRSGRTRTQTCMPVSALPLSRVAASTTGMSTERGDVRAEDREEEDMLLQHSAHGTVNPGTQPLTNVAWRPSRRLYTRYVADAHTWKAGAHCPPSTGGSREPS